MIRRFRLEFEVVLDSNSESVAIACARESYGQVLEVVSVTADGRRAMPLPEEFIQEADEALLQLFDANPLLSNMGIEIERSSCRSLDTASDSTPTSCDAALSSPPEAVLDSDAEMHDDEDRLDESDSGLYLCRWPNGDFSVIKAESKREAILQLDEWAGAEPAWLTPMDVFMMDFQLNDQAEIELSDLGEDTEDLILRSCYPDLNAAILSSGLGQDSISDPSKTAKVIRNAVAHERKRLWAPNGDSLQAHTALGRELQKHLRTVGPVADHYVEHAGRKALQGRTAERKKPN